MSDINNNSGGTSGSQRIGGITINTGKTSLTKNKAEIALSDPQHDGDFHGEGLLSIASLTGTYDARFDDEGYYE